MSKFSGSQLAGVELADTSEVRGSASPRVVTSAAQESKEWAGRKQGFSNQASRGLPTELTGQASTPVLPGLVRERMSGETGFSRRARIGIKTNGKILLIDPTDVIAVEAQGNYTLLRRQSESYLLRAPISLVAAKLEPHDFVRVHRSALVNASWVEELRPLAKGEYVLRIKGGREYTVSRTYRHNLGRLAQSWIGTDSFTE